MPCPNPLAPAIETLYPLYGRLGGPQGWSGWVQTFLPPLRFDSQDHPAYSECTNNCTYSKTILVDVIYLTDWDKDHVDLEWTPPKKDGGSPITGYIIEKRTRFG